MFKWLNFFKKGNKDSGKTLETMSNDSPTYMANPQPSVIPSDIDTSSPSTTPVDISTSNTSITPSDAPISNTSITPSDTSTSNTSITLSDTSTSNTSITLSDTSTSNTSITPSDTSTSNTSITPSDTSTSNSEETMVTDITIKQSALNVAVQIQSLPLFKTIGDSMLSLFSNSNPPSSGQLTSILMQGEKIITAATKSLSNNNEGQNYELLFKEMSKLPPLDGELNHDNLVQSNITSTIQNLAKYYNVCENILKSYNTTSIKTDFDNLTTPLTNISTQYTNLISLFKNFKAKEANLKQEIEAFTNAVNQVHSQGQGVSIDWNGKKNAFEKKSAELTNRRNEYLKEETYVNSQISNLSNDITAFHPKFTAFTNSLMSNVDLIKGPSRENEYSSQLDSYNSYCEQLKSILNIS